MNATVALIESNKIRDLGNGKSEILVKKFSDAFGLCPSEKFIEQPIAAFCSGFLINSNSIATAGHCVIPSRNGGIKLEDIRLVFGFRMNDVGDPNVIINNSEIYKVGEIIGKDFTKDGPDWALIKLDRHVENHEPVQIRKEGKIEDKTELYSIGHPCGLPQKIGTGGAYVRNNSNDDFFVANLDTYHGNSGSPVIENDTHTVEGILVRGETDFQTVNGCKKSLVCPTTGCRGEDCFRINKIVNLIE
jgi:V8-like Glu-specific endopeptidase